MFNSDSLSNLLSQNPGKMRLASSQGRQPLSNSMTKALGSVPNKMVDIAPGESFILADLQGAGQIERIWMTTLTTPLSKVNFNHYGLLRFYWDGEQTPSVEVPFGSFFGVPWGKYTHYTSTPMSCTSGGYNCYFPMPYSQGCRLEIINQSGEPWKGLFFQVQYRELGHQPTQLRFHAQWRRENPTQPGLPYRILDAKGEGHFAGMHLFMQNTAQWLDPQRMVKRFKQSGDPITTIFPEMAGMGMLEGWECMTIDGEATPSVSGTGTEDYFNSGFYFLNGTYSAPQWGCTVRNYLTSRCAAYRFHISDPIPFHQAIIVDMDHGYANQVATDYHSVAYWYQGEPHLSFPGLPSVSQRLPTPVIQNATQFALFTSPIWLSAGLVGMKVIRAMCCKNK